MNPDLDRLLRALDEAELGTAAGHAWFDRKVQTELRVLQDRYPDVNWVRLMPAIWARYRAYLRAQGHPPTLPPTV